MNKVGTYAMVNAKVRAMRSYMIPKAVYQSMISARSVHDLVSILRQTRFQSLIEEVDALDPVDIEKTLFRAEILELKKILKFSKGNPKILLEMLLRSYEGERIKAILRSWHSKDKLDSIYYEKIQDNLPVDAILSAKNIQEILYYLQVSSFKKPIENALESYKDRKTLFSVELSIDRFIFESLFKCIRSFDQADLKIARRMIGVEVDIKNLDWISRYRRYYKLTSAEIAQLLLPDGYKIKHDQIQQILSGKDFFQSIAGLSGIAGNITDLGSNESESLELLENILYHMLYDEASHGFGSFPFSIGAILGYYYLLRIESKNIKTLLYAKAYQIPESEIHDLLIM